MVIFVTGASGLIGKWVMELCLSHGHEVAGFDIKPCPYPNISAHCKVGDVRDKIALESEVSRIKPDVIIHLAARIDLEGKSLDEYDSNTVGVQNVCEVAREQPSVKRVIYTSSMLVCKVGYVPSDDEDYLPDTVYGDSKVETEKIVRRLDGGGVEWCLVRPTTVWGPYMSEHYQSLLRHVRRGTYFHSGYSKLRKSYSFAGNIAYQYLQLAGADKEAIHRRVLYLADYEPLSLRDYIDELADAMDVKRPIVVPVPVAKTLALFGDIMGLVGVRVPFNSFRLNNIRTEYVFDMSETRKVCGDLPYDFRQGVKITARWFLSSESANAQDKTISS